jgi:RNA polymerase sigma-70 factor (ECF subfamily)
MLLADDWLAALPRLRRYARFLTNDSDRADELVGRALARARQPQADAASHAAPYLRLLALLRDVYAAEFARGPAHEASPPTHAQSPGPSERTDYTGKRSAPLDRADAMLVELLRLPLPQREVMVLVAVECMSYEEIAALLRVPVATVMTRLAQAREGLRISAPDTRSAPKGLG